MSGQARVRYRSLVADSGRWEGFPFREGDIVISTPPKSGTTWMQMICGMLVFQTPRLERPLDLTSPWVDMLTRHRDSLVAELEMQRHRRFVKTHTPLDGLPWDERVTYICVGRDPRDVALSFGHHMANLDFAAFLEARRKAVGLDDVADLLSQGPPALPDSEVERFWRWVDDPTPPTEGPSTLSGTLHHLTTFLRARGEDNVILVHYGELEADLAGEMRRLARRLGIAVPEPRWPDLVEAATFDRMRREADVVVPDSTHRIWRDNRRFFHRGRSGQWRGLLDADDLRRYGARVAELADPDVAEWAHRGPILP